MLSIPVALVIALVSKDKSDESGRSPFLSGMNDRIVVLRLTGMIAEAEDDGFLSSVGSVDDVKRKLKKALKDKHIKGILLRIDSPGGTVATSQELYEYIKDIRQRGIPVVASMSDVAASGGYYVACACDRIFAQPGTITGSIGVIMNSLNIAGLEQKIGIEPQTVKSGQFKDIGSPYRPMTAAERDILQKLILDSYDQFVEAVSTGRKMDKKRVRELADGRIYLGSQARQLGLVDDLGGYEKALASLQKLSRERFKLDQDLYVDEGRRKTPFSALMDVLESKSALASPIGQVLPVSLSSRFYNIPLFMMQ